MGKAIRITGPGRVDNRNPKKGEVHVAFDPSPESFISEPRSEKQRVKITIDSDGLAPIELYAKPKQWLLKIADARIDPGRLADLERLIIDETDCHVTIEYTPEPKLPGLAGEAG